MFRALALAALLVFALPAATRLALVTAPQPAVLTADDWLGVWRDGQNVVWISLNPDAFVTVVAAAYNPEPPEGQANHATLQFETMVSGNRVRYTADTAPCNADILNVGGQLIVRDNGECGPARFDGIYPHQ